MTGHEGEDEGHDRGDQAANQGAGKERPEAHGGGNAFPPARMRPLRILSEKSGRP